MSAVRGTKSVIDIDIAVGGKFFGKRFLFCTVFGCFFRMEACIFQHQNAACGKRIYNCLLSLAGISEPNGHT